MASIMRRIGVILVFAGFYTIGFSGSAIAAGNGTQKAILITGASTGIGRTMTEVLAGNGYFVYAGARKQADMDALNDIDNVQAIKLDVTVQEQIDAAVATVEQSGRGLYGLINNAGVFIGGPVADVPVEELQWLMDVNVFGVYRVTQAFAPLIIESGGRISTIGSISGTGSNRFFSQYSMSKHAIEAFTDSLAAEMEPLGVRVSVIEPGNYDSAIGENALARMKSKNEAYARDGSPFAEAYQQWLDRDWGRGQYKAPDEVAQAAMHAMSDPTPLRRYMVVPNEREADWTISKQIEELVQLNQWQAYSYSREELIAKMDAVPASDTDEVELTAMLHDFLKKSNSEAAHAKFWADDLVYTSSNGTRFGKADIMESFAGQDGSEAAALVYTAEDASVRVFGTTAVLTFRLVGTPRDGSASSQYFNSGTFLKRQGAWRAISWQATTIPDQPQT
jgi:NAD(P)-dependent dehydrogenase (short-subunit alcohol dehydrogenase family)/ketosteroid isomerase-like protein